MPRAAPVACPLCLSEAGTPLCGSPSETQDFSSAPVLKLFRSPEEAHSHVGKFQNSLPAVLNKGWPQALAGSEGLCVCPSWVGWGGSSGQPGWRPVLSQKGRRRPHLSHGAEVSCSPLHSQPFVTHTCPAAATARRVALGWGLLLGLLPLEGLPFLCVLPFPLDGAWCSPQKSR